MMFTKKDRVTLQQACHVLTKLAAIATTDLTREAALKAKADLEGLDFLAFAASNRIEEVISNAS